MNIEDSPPWSKSQLRRLGESLLERCAPPEGCPDYNAVMLWHNDLASEVARILTETEWSWKPEQFRLTARSKTVDTLVQKLQRSALKLDRVQDLAGVRIDAEMNLTRQTLLAGEIAHHFGGDQRVTIRDLRQQPHSGYRAVHLWLVVPAGRVEVQIRTNYQSLWANVYEGLADLVGRGIRYDEPHDDPVVQQIVERMHSMSAEIAHDEVVADQLDNMFGQAVQEIVDDVAAGAAEMGVNAPNPHLLDQAIKALSSGSNLEFLARLRQTGDQLRDLRRILNKETEEK
ncbi:ppGpp synthetase catalytic domain-containing protein (RelA/SpoT-type nucleotidyltranferase) [Mycolicibacterium rutilum]|uniref:PpGpp synthetase catalytic domain-containing protein (RelA/SpoT-type nucleotidyltranferase) n=1 Tax=Mycolicibacterium rutilum TaxID=370526 RepID=A0A1H6KRT0_MYCRU|nr:hypothetical protein [Mycolicibacterium rutilum]SEH74246.1 ppGpp synthetase catalytic domain-containing protein (RelA/SpoT-type nucleotidyltranferase) [Mycolicibacterium rutilum]